MHRGILIAIDGPSGAGKSSILEALLADSTLDLTYVKRVTTRARRPNDPKEDQDYRFITMKEFRSLVEQNSFMEYHDYLFGMSYGVLKTDVESVLATNHNALALINLGEGASVKTAFPHAVTIFLSVKPEDVESRLRARKQNTEEQIEERVGNARFAYTMDHTAYDLVSENVQGHLEDCIQEIDSFIRSYL